jgi:hypothetical protein
MINFIESIYNITTTVCEVALCVIIFILIPLLIFRKTRLFSAKGLFYFSYLFGFYLWLLSFLITVKTLGLFWLIVGLLLVGIGVLPLALIGSVITTQWGMFFNLLIDAAILAFLRIVGAYFNKEQ